MRLQTPVLCIILFASACTVVKGQDSAYRVAKIKSIGNYHVIYVTRNDSTFKVVSERQRVGDCTRIRKGRNYPLKLLRVRSVAGSEIDCFSFDEKTVICKEPDIELATASNLRGLCITY